MPLSPSCLVLLLHSARFHFYSHLAAATFCWLLDQISLLFWCMACSPLGRGRVSFLRWLVEAGGTSLRDRGSSPLPHGSPATSSSSTAERCHAMRALGAAIQVDERVLGHADVQAAVSVVTSPFLNNKGIGVQDFFYVLSVTQDPGFPH